MAPITNTAGKHLQRFQIFLRTASVITKQTGRSRNIYRYLLMTSQFPANYGIITQGLLLLYLENKMNMLTSVCIGGQWMYVESSISSFFFFQTTTHGQGGLLFPCRILSIIYIIPVFYFSLSVQSQHTHIETSASFSTPTRNYYHQGKLLCTITQKQQLYPSAHTRKGKIQPAMLG